MKQSEFIKQVQVFEAKMYRLSCRILISKEAGKDAVQEVLLKLWEKIDQFSKLNSLEAYAMQMTKNYCLDQLKLKANQNLSIVHKNIAADTNETEEYATNDKKRLQQIKTAMNQLPEQQKMVMQLRDIENYSFTEIAEILQISEVSARVNLSRARKSIIQKIRKSKAYEAQA